ncbi:unnamed protein product, partial [Owenia fusiformis]
KMADDDPNISVEFVENIAILTMNNGENRISNKFLKGFNDALDKVESNEDIQAIITTGTGRFYSNGLNLNWLGSLREQWGDDEYKKFFENLHKLFLRILSFPMPTIAAINGHCYAAGAMISLGHDYRVFNSQRGWFCINEVHMNLRVNSFMRIYLKTLIPKGRVYREMLGFGRRYTGPELLQDNMVEAIAEPKDLIETAKNVVIKHIPKGGFTREAMKNMKYDMFVQLFEFAERPLDLNAKL